MVCFAAQHEAAAQSPSIHSHYIYTECGRNLNDQVRLSYDLVF